MRKYVHVLRDRCKNGWRHRDADWRVDSGGRKEQCYMGSISPREWAILGVVRPIAMHWKSVLQRFMQQKINNDDSGIAAVTYNAADRSVSHYAVPTPVKNPPLRCSFAWTFFVHLFTASYLVYDLIINWTKVLRQTSEPRTERLSDLRKSYIDARVTRGKPSAQKRNR